MSVEDVIKNAPDDALIWVIIVIIILVFGTPAIFSESTAKEKLWFFGRIGQWLNSRRERGIDREIRINEKHESAINARVDFLEKELNHMARLYQNQVDDIRKLYHDRLATRTKQLQGEIDNLIDRQCELEKRLEPLDLYTGYISYVSVWFSDLGKAGKKGGWAKDIPVFLSFEQYCEKHGYNLKNGR